MREQIVYSYVNCSLDALVNGKFNALGKHVGDGSSDGLINILLNSLGWVGSHIDGLSIKKVGSETEVVSATVGASEESFVSALAVLLVLVASEAEGGGQLLSALLNLALVLGQRTGEFVVVVGTTLQDVLGCAVGAVASSLLHLSLFLQGWDDCLSNVAGLEVGANLGGIGIDQLVVSSSWFGDTEHVVLLSIILQELVGVVGWVSENFILILIIFFQVAGSNTSETIVGNGLSLLDVWLLNIVQVWLSGIQSWVPVIA